jgi:hypothetical protein
MERGGKERKGESEGGKKENGLRLEQLKLVQGHRTDTVEQGKEKAKQAGSSRQIMKVFSLEYRGVEVS